VCLVLHSDGHLTLKVLNEHIIPTLTDGRLGFIECYDIVLRSHGREPLTHLYVLSPHQSSDGQGHVLETVQPVRPIQHERCNWVYKTRREHPARANTWRLQFPSAREQLLAFDATELVAAPARAGQLQFPAVSAALRQIGMTLCVINFGGMRIEPFDPDHRRETTYWLRLGIQPTVRFPFGPLKIAPLGNGYSMMVQPCSVISPGQVLDDLCTRLDRPLRDVLKNDAQEAKGKILDEIFNRPNTSTRIEEHRIYITTTEPFWTWNSFVQGPCDFVGVQPTGLGNDVARTWSTGANPHSETDALQLGRHIYTYIADWAKLQPKSKEEISSAVAPDFHDGISLLVDLLEELGLLKKTENSRYALGDRQNAGMYIQEEADESSPAEDNAFDNLEMDLDTNEIDLGRRDNEIRSKLYNHAISSSIEQRAKSFAARQWGISYDLVYTAGGKL